MRLLLAEDSPRYQETLSYGLRKSGYVVDVAGDGETALWQARNGTYDLLILDIMLPKLDGLSVLRKLREHGCPTHVLMLTVKDTVEDRVQGLRAGADDYLPKPFAFDELVARIEALVRRGYNSKQTTIQLGSIELNTSARTVSKNGKEITVTPREYKILEFLARKKGAVVSRTEIEEHIYSDEKELFSNAVESAISVLRKKLEQEDGRQIIQTRRGLGYVLAAQ